MEYAVYKMLFPQAVHFGHNTLESSEMTFHADRLFSALCHEALKQGEDTLERLVSMTEEGNILLSDAFPFDGNEYFLPRPLARINQNFQDEDVSKRKLFKKLEYLPLSMFPDYLAGNMRVESLPGQDFGSFSMKVSVKLEPGEESEPYRIGTFAFHDDCGLYIIVGYIAADDRMFVEDLLEKLSFSGLGGRRSSGMGRFELLPGKLATVGLERLQGEYQTYMTLSVSLPKDDELENVMTGARYLLVKRSGFVASSTYAKEFRRKRDVYAFQAGACFSRCFSGQILDVSNGGHHPVYCYLKPLFMGLSK